MKQPHSTVQATWLLFCQRWAIFRANRLALVGLWIIVGFVLIAVFAFLLAPYDPNLIDLTKQLQPMSWAHLFGTDNLGRDILSRVIYGAQTSLLIVVLVPFLAAPLGLIIGIVSGYFGGWVDIVLMRIADIFLTFPKLILALAFVAALGPKLGNAILAIALTSWPPYARICRTQTQIYRQADFMKAAYLQGVAHWRFLFRYLPPLCFSAIVIRIALEMGGVVLTAASLSFLGLGAQPPTPEWGDMAAAGRNFLFHEWWVSTLPGLAIFITSLGFNLFGNGLRDVLDPKNQTDLS